MGFRVLLLPFAIALLLTACGPAGASTRSNSSPSPTTVESPAPSPSATPAVLSGQGFSVLAPAGWHSETIADNGAKGVLYGMASRDVKLPQQGIVPDGVIGIEIAYSPQASLPPQLNDAKDMPPTYLVNAVAAVPSSATITAHGSASETSVGGTAAGMVTISYTEAGATRTDVDVAVYHGGGVYMIDLETSPDLLANGRDVFNATLASWHWTS